MTRYVNKHTDSRTDRPQQNVQDAYLPAYMTHFQPFLVLSWPTRTRASVVGDSMTCPSVLMVPSASRSAFHVLPLDVTLRTALPGDSRPALTRSATETMAFDATCASVSDSSLSCMPTAQSQHIAQMEASCSQVAHS